MKITTFLRVRLRARRLNTRSLLLSGLMLAAVPMARAADSPSPSASPSASPAAAVPAATSAPEASVPEASAVESHGAASSACDSGSISKPGCDDSGCDAPGRDGGCSAGLLSTGGDCDAPGSDAENACDGVVAPNGRIQSQLRLGSLFSGKGLGSGCDASGSQDDACAGLGDRCDAATCDAADGACTAGKCDDGSCDSCEDVVTSSCVPCTNQWTVWTEVMFLRRSDASSFPLITDQNTGDTLLNANQLDFQHRAVPRIFLIRDYCDCWGWEIGYFGLQSWDSTGEGGGELSPVLNGPGIPIGSTAPGTIYQAHYGSDLHNAEFNVRRRTSPCVTWIAGFRFLELQESLRAGSIAPTTTDLYSVDTNNQLYGFQVGANAQVLNCGGRFHVDGLFRTGVFSNNAEQTTHSPLGNVIPESVPSLTAGATQTAFLGELGLRGVYQLTNSIGIYGGYSAIWVDGLALAPAQVSATNLFGTPSASINTTDAVFFHGATVGLQASY